MDFNPAANSSARIAPVSSLKPKKKTLSSDWLCVYLDNSRQQDTCKKQFTTIYLITRTWSFYLIHNKNSSKMHFKM